MTKAQAAETLKKFISPNMKAKDYTSDSLKEAVTKAIEVLSDKTEHVKRSTYRKLKEELIKQSSEFVADYGNLHQDKEELQKHYDTLVADASELRMKNERYGESNKLASFAIRDLNKEIDNLKSNNKKLFTTVVTLAIITILTIAVTFAIYA